MHDPSSSAKPAAGGGMLNITVKDKAQLYAAYMPFVKNGGLFIGTQRDFTLGDNVFVLLTLWQNPEKIPIAGKVIWITPRGAQNNRSPGIGVQFLDEGNAQKKIESQLVGTLTSDRITFTM